MSSITISDVALKLYVKMHAVADRKDITGGYLGFSGTNSDAAWVFDMNVTEVNSALSELTASGFITDTRGDFDTTQGDYHLLDTPLRRALSGMTL